MPSDPPSVCRDGARFLLSDAMLQVEIAQLGYRDLFLFVLFFLGGIFAVGGASGDFSRLYAGLFSCPWRIPCAPMVMRRVGAVLLFPARYLQT